MATDALLVALIEVSVWYFLPLGLDALTSVRIRLDQQIALALILLLLALWLFFVRQNQALSKRLREIEDSDGVVWDFFQVHNEKKVLSEEGSKEILWQETFGQHLTLKIRVDANPQADISVRTICVDLALLDLKFNRKSTHCDAYEVIGETAVELWEREVSVAPGRWFVLVSIPKDRKESTVYLEISEKRLAKLPKSEKRQQRGRNR